MGIHPPCVRTFVPPSDDEVAHRRADGDRIRAAASARWAQREPDRRAAIAAGPDLRDVDAAVDCRCGCHPRPADPDLHGGGTGCACQQTPEQRRQAWRTTLAELHAHADDDPWAEREAELVDELGAEAGVLGVTAALIALACPFVITGTCDGRAFYLRERHGTYRVTMATDDDPTTDPWAAGISVPSIDIAGGRESDLCGADGSPSAAVALRVAVDAVRTALLRRRCPHTGAPGPFCPDCGVRRSEAERWRRLSP